MSPGSSYLRLEAICHDYGPVCALDELTLEIPEGTFLTLLGSSGSGKTTLLRVIAGFVRPSRGRVWLNGNDITKVPANRRPVNTVFQRATLFPHLDVAGNVGFALMLAKRPKAEINRRVGEALELVRLSGYQQRKSHELSGGQMQRVTLARALVNQPQLLLLDEPLSALDLKIRLEMEAELRRLHRETGTTFVYVTHDQREALALSDLVALLENGKLEQIGTPNEIYTKPASPFAARFVGDANVLPATVLNTANGTATVELAGRTLTATPPDTPEPGSAWLIVRPEVVQLTASPATGLLRGRLQDVAFRGAVCSCTIEIPDLHQLVKAEIPAREATQLSLDSEVSVSWDEAACRFLPRPD